MSKKGRREKNIHRGHHYAGHDGCGDFFGWLTNSMALFADGWHMGTHAFALGISLMAYILARKYSSDETFVFGA